ncbi:MAG: phosphatase PAP2 family protein [Planctomycetes bacterium]|nr:phosphatase PAP2 family protein [Planctomycetota bacterium]
MRASFDLSFRALVASALCIGIGTRACASDEASPGAGRVLANPEAHLNLGFFQDWGKDLVLLPQEPRSWGAAEYLQIGALAGVGVTLYSQDDRIRDYIQRHRTSVRDRWAENLQHFGGGIGPAVILIGLYGTGEIIGDRRARRTALVAIESLAVSGVFNQALKYATHRHRPNSGDDRSTWSGPSLSTTNLSFASGHTTAAFALATSLAEGYSDVVWVPPLVYGLATATALARMELDKHWASDVFVGALIGYGTAHGLGLLYPKDGQISAIPIVTLDEFGVAVSANF